MGLQVTKWVELESEVTVSISAEDMATALMGEAQTVPAALMCLNSVACFMNGLPDDVIAGMTEEQRATVRDFLQKQVRRFEGDENDRR